MKDNGHRSVGEMADMGDDRLSVKGYGAFKAFK